MDAVVAKCLNCGELLKEPRKLKKFCSYACRGQQRASEATADRTGQIRSKNPKQNKELRRCKMQSVGAVTFAKVNSCTYRVGTRNKRAAGWLMEVAWPGGSRQRWVARVGNHASKPLPLEEAKQAAIEFLRERGKAEPRDFIAELNQIAANEVDRAVLAKERKLWPVNITGGGRQQTPCVTPELRRAILETEIFLGIMSNEFDWERSTDVILRDQAAGATYLTSRGELVVGQRDTLGAEAILYVAPENIPQFLKGLSDRASQSEPITSLVQPSTRLTVIK